MPAAEAVEDDDVDDVEAEVVVATEVDDADVPDDGVDVDEDSE